MNQIKLIVSILGAVAYTSLIWATFVFKGLPVGMEQFAILTPFAVVATVGVGIVVFVYCLHHWDD